jgi:hypothetical protein
MDEFNGLIISTQLSTLGLNPHKYGYIDVNTHDGKQLKFKIGENVKIRSGPAGWGGILTAKTVVKL